MLFEPLGCAVWDNEAASIVVGKLLAFLQTDTAFRLPIATPQRQPETPSTLSRQPETHYNPPFSNA